MAHMKELVTGTPRERADADIRDAERKLCAQTAERIGRELGEAAIGFAIAQAILEKR